MKQPQGVLVLLALVMMAIFVTAGLVLGTIIIREVRLSTISDKGVTALYAAETAAEESIYRIFKLGEDPSTLATAGTLSNGAEWTRESKTTDRRFIIDVLSDSRTAEINLYNNANVNQAAEVESFLIEWSSGTTMEVEISEWNGTTLTSLGTQQFVCTGAPCTPAVINTPVSNAAYEVLITADGGSITDLIVSVFETDGGTGNPVQVEIPTTVVATGEFQGAKQAIQLRVPSPAPWG